LGAENASTGIGLNAATLSQSEIWLFLGSLGLFLIGMHNLEAALKGLAGRSFKVLLRDYTTNPLMGAVIGTVTTALLQSSSVVTLMLIALVGSGVLPFVNALGIIFGANLGTTFTGWLVTVIGFKFDISHYIFQMIAVGSLTYLFLARFVRLSMLGKGLLGFGLILFGLLNMRTAMTSLEQSIDINLIAEQTIVIFLITGFIVTAIIQSSSAMMVIALSALNSGVIDLYSATGLVIGADMGTTMTAILSTMGGSPIKKRVALAHFLFNLTTNLIAVLCIPFYLFAIKQVLGDGQPLLSLVAFHSTMNLVGVVLFIPFTKTFSRFLERRFVNQNTIHLTKLDPTLPEAALEQLKNELGLQLKYLDALFDKALSVPPHSESWFLSKILSPGEGFLHLYQKIKDNHGLLLKLTLRLQAEPLTPDQSSSLSRMILSLDQLSLAAKSLKDIEHNLREIESSSDNLLFSYFQQLQNLHKDTHKILHDPTRSESAHELLKSFYSASQNDFYRLIKTGALDPSHAANLQNLNRDLYLAQGSWAHAHLHLIELDANINS
jgi:phosphate:Na+ symporter